MIEQYVMIASSTPKKNSQTSTTNNVSSILLHLYFNKYFSNILTCTQIRNNLLNAIISDPTINFISVPTKFWKNKAVNKYKFILYDDIDEDVYAFRSFGKSMKRLQYFTPRLCSVDEPYILRGLHLGKDVDITIRRSILDIIHGNQNSYLEAKRSYH